MAEGHVLIVEDEEKIAVLLKDYLEKSGYRTSILDRGDTVIPFVKNKTPDLILLDIMLPGMDGMEVCREIRKFTSVPIIMITAKVEEIDRLLGLELGADDYICKPFSPREVVARVKAVLRRMSPASEEKIIFAGTFVLNEETRRATVDGQELKLTPSEFKLLKVMMSHPNRVFSRNDLVNMVQGYEFEGYDRTIDTHIKNLRKKIAALLPEKEIISSVYGEGYKFTAE
ncbi:MAG TPA: response regulator [Deltaproteobacteria bacterium]|nr:response regulator [Deltaproteobacteria bacterium]HPJ94422.1 response regulator [Deltaproteobacteria bacterium]HPR53241.1 response regulator [Deltaproteobacteria bacterium]